MAAIAVIIALPGSFPLWMKAEQGSAAVISTAWNDTMRDMPEAVIEDPWQARMDRMRRLPVPLLVVSTSLAAVVAATQHTWARFDLSLPAAAAAARWRAATTARLRPDASTGPDWMGGAGGAEVVWAG